MPNTKAWIAAARLRTLPLSVSGIIVGSSLGFKGVLWESKIFWLAILTTIGFQVLSNFANDYGDGIKGTDNERIGERRLVALGIISPNQMRKAMIICATITLIVSFYLIFCAFGKDHFLFSLLYVGLSSVSVIAAIKYTVGKKAYGYAGLGDLFVFLFFGLLSVLGSYFLYTMQLQLDILLLGSTIGFLSVAVLNLNNMRDITSDKEHHKNTLVVKLGKNTAKYYHYALILAAIVLAIIFILLNYESPRQFIFLLAFIPLFFNLRTVYLNKTAQLLDKELKKVALSTFLFAVLFAIFY